MENQSLILGGLHYRLEFTGTKESLDWTDQKSNERDGEYEEANWKMKWKGILELTCKKPKQLFQIQFETFEVEKHWSYTVPDQSLEGMVLHSIKQTGNSFDSVVLADYVGEMVLKLINHRLSEKDAGLLGVIAHFKKDHFNKRVLLEKGILLDEGYQIRLPLVEA